MARSFASASNQYLYQSAPLTTTPISVSYWFYTLSAATKQNPFTIADTDYDGFYTELQADGHVHVNAYDGSDNKAISTNSYSASTWHHFIGVFASSTSRWVMLDGTGIGTDSTSSAPALGTSYLAIGTYYPDPGDYMNGRMAEVTVWNVALSTDNGVSLARGAYALQIHPESIVRYWPFLRTDQDLVGGSSLTAVNAPTWGDHPLRIWYPLILNSL